MGWVEVVNRSGHQFAVFFSAGVCRWRVGTCCRAGRMRCGASWSATCSWRKANSCHQSEAHMAIMGWGVETRVRLTWGGGWGWRPE